MGPTSDGGGSDNVGERAREGVEHLQAAARELIAAARAALDVAEEMVNDPDSLAALAGLVGSVGEMARRATGAGAAATAGTGVRAPGAGEAADGTRPATDRVQRIVVR